MMRNAENIINSILPFTFAVIVGCLQSDLLANLLMHNCARAKHAQRNDLMNAISPYKRPSLKLFLYGDLSLSLEINKLIFEKVYGFTIETKRF